MSRLFIFKIFAETKNKLCRNQKKDLVMWFTFSVTETSQRPMGWMSAKGIQRFPRAAGTDKDCVEEILKKQRKIVAGPCQAWN